MRKMMIALVASSAMVAPVAAKPALRDVPEIDNGLFAVGLAHEIRKNCPKIKARYFRALSYLADLKRDAIELGYDEDEIRGHLESDAEKKRLRAQAAHYMQSQGLDQTKAGYCALGKAEIARNSQTGALLRVTD